MKYPKYDIYEMMYKRYFNKGVDFLIKEGNLKKDDFVLDICGGNGRLTKEVLKYTKNVSYVDREQDMIPLELESMGVKVYNEKIEDFVDRCKNKYTKVFCEQAINYWLLKIDVLKLASIIEKDGLLIFNTFTKEPSAKPMIKTYDLDGISYIEISYLVKRKVKHVQICEGLNPHFTEFDWISEKDYKNILEPYFDITIKKDNNSALYICRRK